MTVVDPLYKSPDHLLVDTRVPSRPYRGKTVRCFRFDQTDVTSSSMSFVSSRSSSLLREFSFVTIRTGRYLISLSIESNATFGYSLSLSLASPARLAQPVPETLDHFLRGDRAPRSVSSWSLILTAGNWVACAIVVIVETSIGESGRANSKQRGKGGARYLGSCRQR